MTKIRAKAIKLYWKIAKERCPFHEEEMAHSFLEGFIDCAEYLLLQNTDLEKENAELKKELKDANEKVVNLACNQNKDLKRKINKAKEIIKNLMKFAEIDCREYEEAYKEAEQFVKE